MAENSVVEEQYVAYPRRGYGSRYGTLARLEALGRFCKRLNQTLIALELLIAYLEFSLNSLIDSKELITYLMVAVAGVLTSWVIAKRASILAVAMGWHAWIANIVALMFFILSVVAAVTARSNQIWAWCIPPIAAYVGAGIGLYVANYEMRRYGIPISPFTSNGSHEMFAMAVEARRALEQNPNPLASTDMYSGEPPRAA